MALIQEMHLFLRQRSLRKFGCKFGHLSGLSERRSVRCAASAVATSSVRLARQQVTTASHLLNTMSLSIPVSYHRSSAPHHRLQARSERRRQLLQVQEKMQGDLIALGYFYAELKVGTPPQTFSLIVDTGSSVTAIPCTGCRDCGPHTNPRFEPESSLTFRQAPCGGSLYCTSCTRGVCGYRVSYQEGSSYSGFLARDVIRLGVRGACVAIESFPFGCSTEETGLFTSQQADGIMGLGTSRRHAEQSNPTVLEALVERRLVEDVFSLCIGALRGTLTFGMPQLATARAKYWRDITAARSQKLQHESDGGWALSLLSPLVALEDLKAAVCLAGEAEATLRQAAAAAAVPAWKPQGGRTGSGVGEGGRATGGGEPQRTARLERSRSRTSRRVS